MAESETYEGGCHCGRVRYRATTTLDRIIDCNCSFCTKRGVLWNYVQPSNFELLAGEQDLADYQFNNKVIHHVFCRHCGVGSYSHGPTPDGSSIFAIRLAQPDAIRRQELVMSKWLFRR